MDKTLYKGLSICCDDNDGNWTAFVSPKNEELPSLSSFSSRSKLIVVGRSKSWIDYYRKICPLTRADAGDMNNCFDGKDFQIWSYFRGEEKLQDLLSLMGIESVLRGDNEASPLLIESNSVGKENQYVVTRRCQDFLLVGYWTLVSETLEYINGADHSEIVIETKRR